MEQWDDYTAVNNGRYDWQAIMERYGMTYLFLSVKDQPSIVAAAQAAPGWQEIYRDEQAVIFRKQ